MIMNQNISFSFVISTIRPTSWSSYSRRRGTRNRCELITSILILTCLLFFTLTSPPQGGQWGCAALSSSTTSSTYSDSTENKVLVIGASGGTGLRALQGLLDVGYQPQQLRILTRDVEKESVRKLQKGLGFETISANLDDELTLPQAIMGCNGGCYIHSLSSDSKRRDTAEVDRARRLAKVLQSDDVKSIKHVVFNSAVGEEGHGVYRIGQKQAVERVFMEECPSVKLTALRANLFMEELWKEYTRPAILKGKFPFSVKPERRIYLTSVRDMGRIAGSCLQNASSTRKSRIINVAGDVLSPVEISSAFAAAQNSKCQHSENKVMAFVSRLFFRDLFATIKFYRRTTDVPDMHSLKGEFFGLLTSFDDFLRETNWGDESLTYEDLGKELFDDARVPKL